MAKREAQFAWTLHETLRPTADRLGAVIGKTRGPRDGVVAFSLRGEGGDEFFWYTGDAKPRRGAPPLGTVHVLRVTGSASKLRRALESARSPNELLGTAGLEIRGDVAYANQLVPQVLRLLAEVQSAAKAPVASARAKKA